MALPAFFDPIVNQDTKVKVALGIIVLVVLVAAPWWFVIEPTRERIALLDGELKQVEKEIVQQQAILAQFAVFERQEAELRQTLEALVAKLPSEREMPPLYRTLSDTAFQVGLAVTLFQPRDPRIRDFYAEIPITVTAEGGYHDVATFFDRLAALARVVTVNEWKLTGLNRTKAPLRAELTLATYTYRPPGSAPAPKPGGKQ